MNKTIEDRTLALAGLFQSAYLVDQIANKGMVDSSALESTIASIIRIDATDTVDVFGGLEGVATGLSVMVKQLSAAKKDINLQVTRYVMGMLHLENKLNKSSALMKKIGEGIDSAAKQKEHFHITHENVIANLADTYKNTISTIKPQILVQGNHGFLQAPENANKVRALLFGGIRSAVLWRQCNGTRWQILFKRKGFVNEGRRLLDTLRQ